MNWASLIIFSLLLNSGALQAPDTRKWNTVETLCGKLIRSEDIPEKGSANTYNEKTKPVKRAILRLYLRNEEMACCERQQPLAETTSGRDGGFQFKKAAPGDYWIVAKVEGKDYNLAITYVTDNKSDVKCPDILYALKKEQLQLERVIQVD
jgi:hypothetical protein